MSSSAVVSGVAIHILELPAANSTCVLIPAQVDYFLISHIIAASGRGQALPSIHGGGRSNITAMNSVSADPLMI